MIYKRFLDILFSLIGLLLTWPILLVTALIIRITMGSPVLFRQMRPGLQGKPFVMYKFRTMHDLRDEDGKSTLFRTVC